MDLTLALQAIIMGLVEGFTEFLPISSTGHLILAGSLIGFTGETAKVFDIAIQAGAMLAVIWEYRVRIGSVIMGLGHDPKAQRLVLNLIVAFLPAALLGLLFSGMIKDVLFRPVPVAVAFIVGGIVIWLVERNGKVREANVRIQTVDDMRVSDAFKVGLAQAFSLIPGTSRSGATIIGGMLLGLSRKAATEFSFFLAIPTLLAATVYSVVKERELLTLSDLPHFAIGGLAAFVSAFLCVRWLLRYISSHDFTIFAWYRIVFGIVILVTAHYNLVDWAH
jgi:undecaprenyl-diphosphatase